MRSPPLRHLDALSDAHESMSTELHGRDPEEKKLKLQWQTARRERIALEKKRHSKNGTKKNEDVTDDSDDEEQQWLMAMNALPTTDPFACFCRCKFKKLGQSYILHERTVVHPPPAAPHLRRGDGGSGGRVTRELVLVGPHWIGVVVTLTIIVGSTALFLHQQCTLLPWYYSAITLAFCTTTLYYLYGVACKDPGIVVPRSMLSMGMKATGKKSTVRAVRVAHDDDDDELNERGTQATTTFTDDDDDDYDDAEADALESGDRSTSPRARASITNTSLSRASSRFNGAARFCDICEITQAVDTEHCDDCGVCIDEYDHHCPWMGKCIGKNNMHAFKMFNLCWVVYVVFVLFVSIQNVDWGQAAVERLHRLSTGEWVPMGTTEAPPHRL